MIFAKLHQGKNCGCVFKKQNCLDQVQFFNILRGFFSGFRLAVGRQNRRRILDILVMSSSTELRPFLLTVCLQAPDSTTNSISSGSFDDAAGSIHFSVCE